MWPRMERRTLLEMSFEVGLFGASVGAALVSAMKTASGRMTKRSMMRNMASPRFESIEYRRVTETVWIMAYSAMYLKHASDVVSAERPSRMT